MIEGGGSRGDGDNDYDSGKFDVYVVGEYNNCISNDDDNDSNIVDELTNQEEGDGEEEAPNSTGSC